MTKKKTEAQKAAKKEKRKALSQAVPGSAQAEAAGLKAAVEQENKKATLRVAQMANLHMAGMSLEEIGNALGATVEEVEQMLNSDMNRVIRNQPQLRQWARKWLSGKYTQLLDVNWKDATDVESKVRFEAQDRALRTLDSLRKLHGADAPTQTEVVVDAAPEAIDAIVNALAKQEGLAYQDPTVFDVIDVEQVHEAAEQTAVAELEAAEIIDMEAENG